MPVIPPVPAAGPLEKTTAPAASDTFTASAAPAASDAFTAPAAFDTCTAPDMFTAPAAFTVPAAAPPSFVLLQTDARMQTAADWLCQNGCTQLTAEQLPQADFMLLGPPTPTLQPFAGRLRQRKDGALLFAGGVARDARLQAAAWELPAIDYLQSETLAIANAVYTAEGALGLLLGATPDALWGARLVLIGYGRIARALAPRLQALGVRLTVAARSPAARAMAAALGTEAAPLEALPRLAKTADFLVNTVPAPVVDRTVLDAAPPRVYILDLASAPGGVDWQSARQLGLRAQDAPGLPGRCCPVAAGKAIGRTVLEFLHRSQEEER